MTILKIAQTEEGEVAYLFDGERVIKVFVEDYTVAKRPRRETETHSSYEGSPTLPPLRRRQQPPAEDLMGEESSLGPAPIDPSARPKPLRPPPGIKSIFGVPPV